MIPKSSLANINISLSRAFGPLVVTALCSLVSIVNEANALDSVPAIKVTKFSTGANVETPYGYSRVRGNARRGSRSEKFELRHDDCAKTRREVLDCVEDRQRVEQEEMPAGRLQKIGRSAWYGWSMYFPKDFQTIDPASVTIAQVRVVDGPPAWGMNGSSRPFVTFSDDEQCFFDRMSNWKGSWVDVVVFADYSTNLGPSGAFKLWINNKLAMSSQKTDYYSARHPSQRKASFPLRIVSSIHKQLFGPSWRSAKRGRWMARCYINSRKPHTQTF